MTGWPRPCSASGPEKSRLSISAWATEVSWYSSSSTTLNFAALDLADLRAALGEPRGERDLVGEVHQAEVRLEAAVGLDQAEQLGAPVDRGDRLLVLSR